MAINWRLKRLLVDKEIMQAELVVETSEALNVKKQTVLGVITGHKRSARIEEHIAARLGDSREDLFSYRRQHHSILPGKRSRPQ